MLFEDFYVKMDRRKDTPQMARLRRFVECGLQVFLLVVMSVLAPQSPFFGIMSIMCYPASILFVSVRFGLREGLFVALLAFAIEAVILTPFIGLQLFLITAPVGLALGYMVKRKWPYFKVICVSSVAASFVLAFTSVVLSFFFSDLAASLQSITLFPSFVDFDFTGIDMTNEEGFRTFVYKLVSIGWPSFLLLAGLAMTIPSIAWAMRLLNKLGEDLNEISMERIESFRLSAWATVAMGIGLITLFAGSDMQSGLMYQIGINVTLICVVLEFFAGVAFFLWICRQRNLNVFVKALLFFGLISFSITSFLFPLIGLMDPIFDFRKQYEVKFNCERSP